MESTGSNAAGGLAGKVAIVTGAGSRDDGIGNGRAASILLARRGARVALLDENVAWAERTRAMIAAEGGESFVVRCDVARLADCEAAYVVFESGQAWREALKFAGVAAGLGVKAYLNEEESEADDLEDEDDAGEDDGEEGDEEAG